MLNKSIELARKLNIKWPPIIQAPMAGGITTPQLVSEVSNAGGLGSFATGYLTTDQVEKNIKEIKLLTQKPFSVNLFIPNKFEKDMEKIKRYNQALNRFRIQLGMPEENDIDSILLKEEDNLYEIIDTILRENIKIVSFTFGNLEKSIIDSFKSKGIYLIGTANSLEEANILSESKIDAIVAQGYEAGGHRGGFSDNISLVGTIALVSQLVKEIEACPIIATGGIMTGNSIMVALSLGASAIQMGTAFLTTKESGANKLYKNELINAKKQDYDPTVLTKAYSGKLARALKTEFTSYMDENDILIPPYPVTNSLTQPIRKKAIETCSTNIMSMWAGQGVNVIPVILGILGGATASTGEVLGKLGTFSQIVRVATSVLYASCAGTPGMATLLRNISNKISNSSDLLFLGKKKENYSSLEENKNVKNNQPKWSCYSCCFSKNNNASKLIIEEENNTVKSNDDRAVPLKTADQSDNSSIH